MKHDLKTTSILILLFVVAQIVGLFITSEYINVSQGKVEFSQLPLGIERPQMSAQSSLIYILVGVLLGTLILFVLIKFKAFMLWKFWYAIALILTLTISFKAFFNEYVSFIVSFILTLIRVKKPNIYINNTIEIFLYGGIAAIFVDLFDLKTAFLLLVLISIYDMIAVWKSKHMIKLAKFQTKSRLFAGFSLNPNQNLSNDNVKISTSSKKKYAILGGGDIAFPLLFAGTLMKNLIVNGMSKELAFLYSLIPVATTTIALFMLFYFAKEKKFYPAMPFLSIGSFIGALVVLII